MEDLLQSQVEDSLRLAMPDGLKELMCDISREVLRVQPPNLYHFISQYLEALLLTRDTLHIACQVCEDIFNCSCEPALDEELAKLGLDRAQVATVRNVLLQRFDKSQAFRCVTCINGNYMGRTKNLPEVTIIIVNEASLISQLLKKTDIDINAIEEVQRAVRNAFIAHQRSTLQKKDLENIYMNKAAHEAAENTIKLYEKLKLDEDQARNVAAVKIQAAFRKHLERKVSEFEQDSSKSTNETLEDEADGIEETTTVLRTTHKPDLRRASGSRPIGIRVGRLSSTSLAGSLINLPKYMPYSVHDMAYEDFEEPQSKLATSHASELEKGDKKKIVFNKKNILHEIESSDEVSEDEDITEDIESNSSGNVSDNIEDAVHAVHTYDELVNEHHREEVTFVENVVKEAISFVHKKVFDKFENSNADDDNEVDKEFNNSDFKTDDRESVSEF